MAKKNPVVCLVALVFACAAAEASAQATQPAIKPPAQPDAPGSVNLGPLKAIPGIDAKYGRDDNLFLSNANKRSSNLLVLAPYVALEGQSGPHKFGGLFRYEHGEFHSSHADDYDDYLFEGKGDLAFSGRAGLGLRAEHRRGHDPRGSTDRPGGASPDEYNNTGAEGVFRYGAPGAQGRIEVDAGFFKREYQNNRASTVASDRETKSLGGTFYWRVAPKTELLFNAGRRRIDYDLSTSTQDSDETRMYVGAKWEATAATTGVVKVGKLKKEFDASGRQDYSGGSWDAAVQWKPRTYSTVDLSTSRQTNESTGLGDYILTNSYSAAWTHAWNSRFRTQLLGNYRKDSFQGGGASREDKTKTLGVAAIYQFRRWLRLGAELTHTTRDSSAPAFDYDRNQIFLTVGVTL